jgi:hypothetical protein
VKEALQACQVYNVTTGVHVPYSPKICACSLFKSIVNHFPTYIVHVSAAYTNIYRSTVFQLSLGRAFSHILLG